MNPFKKLAGDTAIYGMSSIVGRFLNWWLVPYYSFIFIPEIYGVVTNLYSYVAFFLVLLIYGMETSYFRYASRSPVPEQVYSTSLISLFATSLSFIILVSAFKQDIATFINYPDHPEYIFWLAIILGIDAFTAIPFARLRLNNRPVKFAVLKLISIGFNIGLNLFFFSVCPKILQSNPESFINVFYSRDIGVGYVFIANLLSSLLTLILLLPEIYKVTLNFNSGILKQMLNYGFPILIVGLAGMVNQNIDKILIPFLVPEDQNPMFQVGIYGANYKLAVLMNMFIQSFRYAFEPFFFSRDSSGDDKQIYGRVMKYFVILGLSIFMGMVLYLDIIKIIIDEGYHEGLRVVPVILMANLFYGVYFVLSLWYKLKDLTRYGAYMALTGAFITLALNILLIPLFGYTGSAIAVFVCYFTMMVMSYLWGQKYYPVPYDLKRLGIYFGIATASYGISLITSGFSDVLKYTLNSVVLLFFIYLVFNLEKKEIKSLFSKKNKN
ncbi:MAG: oligosaccharide flippase family protein [Prolixibacteraceae bacterium]|nr:oligosaccharide flippase family protein [Prolixibacteraceae bacterium]